MEPCEEARRFCAAGKSRSFEGEWMVGKEGRIPRWKKKKVNKKTKQRSGLKDKEG
jgi:hypothetical protein